MDQLIVSRPCGITSGNTTCLWPQGAPLAYEFPPTEDPHDKFNLPCHGGIWCSPQETSVGKIAPPSSHQQESPKRMLFLTVQWGSLHRTIKLCAAGTGGVRETSHFVGVNFCAQYVLAQKMYYQKASRLL